MIECLARNIGVTAAFFIARDWFLVSVKVGDSEDCQELQKKVDDLKGRMGVNIPIKVTEHPAMPFAAHGCHCYGAAGITVPNPDQPMGIETENDDLQIAIMAHEISHIKHNDGLKLMVIAITALAASLVFTWMVLPGLFGWYVLPGFMVVGEMLAGIPVILAIFAYSRSVERAADVEACKYLTDNQKKAIAIFFEKRRIQQMVLRNDPKLPFYLKIFFKCIRTADGEYRLWGLTHPTLRSRAEYFASQCSKPEDLKTLVASQA